MEEVFRKITLSLTRSISLETNLHRLADYIKKQVQLEELVTLKNTYLAKDPLLAKRYGDQAMAINKELKEIAHNALKEPAVQRELEARHRKVISQHSGFWRFSRA